MRLCEIVSSSDTVVDRELETKDEVDGFSDSRPRRTKFDVVSATKVESVDGRLDVVDGFSESR